VNLLRAPVVAVVDGRATVSTPFGEVTVEDRGLAGTGDIATIALRPEALDFARAGEGGASGRVTARYYSGSLVDYRVQLASGEELHVQRFPGAHIQEGEEVMVRAPAEAFWLIGAAP
jgi:putative spermidine/putrescine transport system ATP-binding protein